MHDRARKLIAAYCALCVLVTSGGWCFHKHVETLTSKVSELLGKKPCADENDTPARKINHDSAAKQQLNGMENDKPLHRIFFGIDWSHVSTEISNNWWIIALSLLLPSIVFWRIQHGMRKRLQEWKRLFVRKEKAYNFSRRLTLPDLTLAKHVRRESLAELTVKLSNHPRKLSQCNSLQLLRKTKQNLFERNDDTQGETKRTHKIRRPH